MKFHYCLEHDRICLACPDCVEKARKESFENGRIVGFEAGLVDELVEKRVEKSEVRLKNVIEILPCTEKARESIAGVPIWEN